MDGPVVIKGFIIVFKGFIHYSGEILLVSTAARASSSDIVIRLRGCCLRSPIASQLNPVGDWMLWVSEHPLALGPLQ